MSMNYWNNEPQQPPNLNGISNQDLFKLMDRLSINEIGALVAGLSPNDVCYNWDYDQNGIGDKYYLNTGYDSPKNANQVFSMLLKVLSRAIIAGELKANIIADTNNQSLYLDDTKKDWLAIGAIDTDKTTILRDDIKKWFDDRGVYPPIFFPNGKKDDYMNPNHECYSPELALCVRAWEVAQTAHYDDKTVKQFIADWIKDNAKQYGWKNNQDEKEPMGEKKLQELASVANWQTKGGAVKGNPNLKEPAPPLTDTKPNINELKINLQKKPPQNQVDEMPF